MGTPFSNTQQRSHTMKFFAVIPAILAAAAAEAQLPIAAQYIGAAGLYNGAYGYAAPYAAAYAAPAATAVDAKFAYGAPVTALNAGPLTAGPVAAAAPVVAAAPAVAAGPLTAGPVAAAPALAATAPIVGAQYAAAYTPAVAAAPAAYAAAPVAVAAAPAAYAAAPVAVAAAPLAAPVAGPVSSQFQAQDEFGNLAYGYQNINSAKQEQGNTYGGVTGSYTYADEAGVPTVNYVADDLGFRVAGDNLPVAPVYNAALPVAPVFNPAPVVDTPEVAEAKAAFFAAFEAEKARTKRSAQLATFGPTAYAGLASGLLPAGPIAAAAYAAPVAAAAPLAAAAPAREAILTTVKLNPGHAISYRVD